MINKQQATIVIRPAMCIKFNIVIIRRPVAQLNVKFDYTPTTHIKQKTLQPIEDKDKEDYAYLCRPTCEPSSIMNIDGGLVI